MNIVQITRTLAIGLVLVLTATGLWATGAEEDATAAADKKYVTDPVTGKEVSAPEYQGERVRTVPVPPRTVREAAPRPHPRRLSRAPPHCPSAAVAAVDTWVRHTLTAHP